MTRGELKLDNGGLKPATCSLDKKIFSHCLIEWDEPNCTISVVKRKNIKSVDVQMSEICAWLSVKVGQVPWQITGPSHPGSIRR